MVLRELHGFGRGRAGGMPPRLRGLSGRAFRRCGECVLERLVAFVAFYASLCCLLWLICGWILRSGGGGTT